MPSFKTPILLGALLGISGSILGACTSSQVSTTVTDGQLFCAYGPTIVSMVSTTGAAILAKGATSDAVKEVCSLIGGIAVSPPSLPVPSVTIALPPTLTIPLKS